METPRTAHDATREQGSFCSSRTLCTVVQQELLIFDKNLVRPIWLDWFSLLNKYSIQSSKLKIICSFSQKIKNPVAGIEVAILSCY